MPISRTVPLRPARPAGVDLGRLRAGLLAGFLGFALAVAAVDPGTALDATARQMEKLKAPWLVHVGSGIPAVGEKQTSKLLAKLPEEAPYVGVGVGKRFGREFMKPAAERTGGAVAQPRLPPRPCTL